MEKTPTIKVRTLAVLYLVQGLPFGFQATALPLYLREQGISLTLIGFSELLTLPWLLKALWGPLIERFGRHGQGHYKTWFAPLQLVLAITCASAALLAGQERLGALIGAIFLMNLWTAVMDVAVDGFAVAMLKRRELGIGNIAQVVGYKFGMLIGGGLLVWASQWIAWSGLFATLAVIIAATAVWSWRLNEASFRTHETLEKTSATEQPSSAQRSSKQPSSEQPSLDAPPRVLLVVRWLLSWFRSPAAWRVALVIVFYKFGESIADKMFVPFLLDGGIARGTIGLWVGTWGMVFSLLGSAAGGWFASRRSLRAALRLAACLRALPVIGEWALSLSPSLDPTWVIVVTSAEHFFGGALTTALFAYMMSQVDRRMGAAHFTLLATLELLGKGPARAFAGWVADHVGYDGAFAIAALACIVYIPMAWLAPRPRNT